MPIPNERAAVLLAACLAACAARQTIRLDPLRPAAEAGRRLQEQLAAPAGCLVAWGDLPALPDQRPLRLVAGDAAVEAVAVCTRPGQLTLLHDARLRRSTLLFFRGGRFLAGHPSDPSAKAELMPGAQEDALGLFADPHPEGLAGALLKALGGLVRRFLVVVWDPAA